MSRIIRCDKCHLNLGEIRDAKLRKGIVHFCEPCSRNMKAQVAAAASNFKKNPDFSDIFGGVFK